VRTRIIVVFTVVATASIFAMGVPRRRGRASASHHPHEAVDPHDVAAWTVWIWAAIATSWFIVLVAWDLPSLLRAGRRRAPPLRVVDAAARPHMVACFSLACAIAGIVWSTGSIAVTGWARTCPPANAQIVDQPPSLGRITPLMLAD
jgi:hypothetical protein